MAMPCPFCDHELPEATPACPGCGRDPRLPRKRCPACQGWTPPREKRCSRCGVAIRSELRWKIPLIIAIFVVGFIAAAVIQVLSQ